MSKEEDLQERLQQLYRLSILAHDRRRVCWQEFVQAKEVYDAALNECHRIDAELRQTERKLRTQDWI